MLMNPVLLVKKTDKLREGEFTMSRCGRRAVRKKSLKGEFTAVVL